MRELHYGNGSIVVSFDLCTAVFDYALALALASTSDLISVPIVVNGAPAMSNLLLGPATQLFCTPSEVADVDLDDESVIVDIRNRVAHLQPIAAPAVALSPFDAEHVDYDA
jgi:hypothetical protein